MRKHENVLEIGTGSGYMAALLAQRARHVLSVEIRPELVTMARLNRPVPASATSRWSRAMRRPAGTPPPL